MDLLREVKKDELHSLKKHLEKKMPESMTVLMNVHLMIEFGKSLPENKIFVSDEDVTAFVCATGQRTELQCFNAVWDLNELEDQKLLSYLTSIPGWDWSRDFLIFGEHIPHAKKLCELIGSGKLNTKYKTPVYTERCHILRLHEEDMWDEISLKGDFKFGSLKPSHAPTVLQAWKHSQGIILKDFEESLRLFPSVAIFLEEDHECKNPVSWVILYHFGQIGNLYSNPSYRKLGLASAVSMRLCKDLSDRNFPSIVLIEEDNRLSYDLHKRLGYRDIGDNTFLLFGDWRNS